MKRFQFGKFRQTENGMSYWSLVSINQEAISWIHETFFLVTEDKPGYN